MTFEESSCIWVILVICLVQTSKSPCSLAAPYRRTLPKTSVQAFVVVIDCQGPTKKIVSLLSFPWSGLVCSDLHLYLQYAGKSLSLLKLLEQLRCRALCGAMLQVENCCRITSISIRFSLTQYRPIQEVFIQNSHSSTQSSLGWPLCASGSFSCAVTRSTHSS